MTCGALPTLPDDVNVGRDAPIDRLKGSVSSPVLPTHRGALSRAQLCPGSWATVKPSRRGDLFQLHVDSFARYANIIKYQHIAVKQSHQRGLAFLCRS